MLFFKSVWPQSNIDFSEILRIFTIFGWLQFIFCHSRSNLINYNDVEMKPISWDANSITFYRDGEYFQYSLKSLRIEEKEIFTLQFFYIDSDREFFAVVKWEEILLVNSLDGTINSSHPVIESGLIYTPQHDSKNLWAFRQVNDSDQIQYPVLVMSISLDGKIVQQTKPVQIGIGKDWKFITIFKWNDDILSAFLFDIHLIILRIKPFINKTNTLESIISAIIPPTPLDLESVPHFIPSYSQPFFTYPFKTGPTNDTQYYVRELIPLLDTLDTKIDGCRKGITTQNLYRLDSFLADAGEIEIKECNDQIPYIISSEETFFFLDKRAPKNTPSFWSLGHEVEKIRMVYLMIKDNQSVSSLLVCDFIPSTSFDEFKIENCVENDVEIGKDLIGKIKHYAIDEKKGSFKIVIDSGGLPVSYPGAEIIHCKDFTSCPTCEISRYIHNCKWTGSSCSKGAANDVCFKNLQVIMEEIDDQTMKLTGEVPYTFRPEFGDRVYVRIDDEKLIANYSGNYFYVLGGNFTAQEGMLLITRDPDRKRDAGLEEKFHITTRLSNSFYILLTTLPLLIFFILIVSLFIRNKSDSDPLTQRDASSTGPSTSFSTPTTSSSNNCKPSQTQ